MNPEANELNTYDYIVVGSGAGGGPLAANLAKAGYAVLLMEAGGRDENLTSDIPVFHAKASEDPAIKWDYYIKHYANEQRQSQDWDSKFVAEQDGVRRDGILYPRAGTLGGCTAHNAMITVYPHSSDWDHLAALTGDTSWSGANMRQYFERLEQCTYYPGTGIWAFFRKVLECLHLLPRNAARHGSKGWLTTSTVDPHLVFGDHQLIAVIKSAVKEALDAHVGNPAARLGSELDPNDWRLATESPEGVAVTPLATRVLLDDGKPPMAEGVEYMEGNSLYRADPRAYANKHDPARKQVFARREVIVAAGAFNTPQLLMLSGIGPRAELERFKIPVRVDLPGVGANLQDRYEVGVVTKFKQDFSLLKGASFAVPAPGQAPDPFMTLWKEGKGLYTSNGAVIGIIKRSKDERPNPDLYIFGLPGEFKGYYPGYSDLLGKRNNYFTWAILKAHTNNTAGTVTLRSDDPRDMSEINFHYFDEGNDRFGEDMESVVAGVQFVREMNKRIALFEHEEKIPGPDYQTEDQIRDFVKRNAWGHHASCTCKMGAEDDATAVLDSKFRVRGVNHLRVVDASVFSRIPGMFIVTAIYMISEKASDDILDAAK